MLIGRLWKEQITGWNFYGLADWLPCWLIDEVPIKYFIYFPSAYLVQRCNCHLRMTTLTCRCAIFVSQSALRAPLGDSDSVDLAEINTDKTVKQSVCSLCVYVPKHNLNELHFWLLLCYSLAEWLEDAPCLLWGGLITFVAGCCSILPAELFNRCRSHAPLSTVYSYMQKVQHLCVGHPTA